MIVGAGVAGLTAAKRLLREEVSSSRSSTCSSLPPDVLIVEASNKYGGRVQKDTSHFADYPLDLGASWVNKGQKRIPLFAQNRTQAMQEFLQRTMTTPAKALDDYQSDKIYSDGRPPTKFNMGSSQALWVNYSWYDFLRDQIVAPILKDHHFVYNCPVDRIMEQQSTTTNKKPLLVACSSQEFQADHVIVTAPLQILQDGDIHFSPPIPKHQRRLLGASKMWQGFKIFLQFTHKFYYDAMEWKNIKDGELEFWDYSRVQPNTKQHILAGYFIGDTATPYQGLTEEQIVPKVLKLLNRIFGNHKLATRSFQKHMIVNWSQEPHIRGTYSNQAVQTGPMDVWKDNKLLVAGEAFPIPAEHNGWVDGAALSGLHAAELILHEMDHQRDPFTIPADLLEE